jgi:regulator of protease activity HflC (stomatin/prohibitin superfamily)
MKRSPFTFVAILLTSLSFAQEPVIEDNSLNAQFDKLYKTSTSYQAYKVVGKAPYLQLKQNVLDSLETAHNKLSEKHNLLTAERESNTKNIEVLNKTALELQTSVQKENYISFFGLQVKKTSYNLSLWAFILALILTLLYFILKFSNNNSLSNKVQNDLKDIDFEFEQYRKKSIEREQKLRRALQDEINKQRNS